MRDMYVLDEFHFYLELLEKVMNGMASFKKKPKTIRKIEGKQASHDCM